MYFVYDEVGSDGRITRSKYQCSKIVNLAKAMYDTAANSESMPIYEDVRPDGTVDTYDKPWIPIAPDQVLGMKLFVDYVDNNILEATTIHLPGFKYAFVDIRQTLITMATFADFVNELYATPIYHNRRLFDDLLEPDGKLVWYTDNANIITAIYGNSPASGLTICDAIATGNIPAGKVECFDVKISEYAQMGDELVKSTLYTLEHLTSLKISCYYAKQNIDKFLQRFPELSTLELFNETVGSSLDERRGGDDDVVRLPQIEYYVSKFTPASYMNLANIAFIGITIRIPHTFLGFKNLNELTIDKCQLPLGLKLEDANIKKLTLCGISIRDIHGLPKQLKSLNMDSFLQPYIIPESFFQNAIRLESLTIKYMPKCKIMLGIGLDSLKRLEVDTLDMLGAVFNNPTLEEIYLSLVHIPSEGHINSANLHNVTLAHIDRVSQLNISSLFNHKNSLKKLSIYRMTDMCIDLTHQTAIETLNIYSVSNVVTNISHLTNITELDASYSDLMTVPASKKLAKVRLNLCTRITDDSLRGVGGIIEFDAAGTGITTVEPWKSTLVRLNVDDCKHFDTRSLDGCDSLKILNIDSGSYLPPLPSLFRLVASEMKIESQPHIFQDCHKLRYLELTSMTVTQLMHLPIGLETLIINRCIFPKGTVGTAELSITLDHIRLINCKFHISDLSKAVAICELAARGELISAKTYEVDPDNAVNAIRYKTH